MTMASQGTGATRRLAHASPLLAAEEPALVRLSRVSKTYDRQGVPVQALFEVDFEVAHGEFVAVMGPSGSGKSTLLHILGLLDGDYEGTYEFAGRRVSGQTADELSVLRNGEIGFVFQTFHLIPSLTILENVALPSLYARELPQEECEARARRRLEQVWLGDRLHHRPMELSIGQRQRAAIARALINEPRLLLADEPTGALDTKNVSEILDILSDLHRTGCTIVLITHDREVAPVAERIVHVRDGQILDGQA